jgi:hypothetical protein
MRASQEMPGFVNFKCAVWHKSFKVLLDKIPGHSYTGCWICCGDEISQHVYPFIYILSADYKEQYVHLLIDVSITDCGCSIDVLWL